MAVVSVSLTEDSIDAIDRIRRIYGLKGRSEAVRTAVNIATSDLQDLEELEGQVEGVLITIRRDHADPWMSAIQARHVNSIKTQLHSHLRDKKCLEVMIVSCGADDLRSMMFEIEGTGKADYIRFVRNRSFSDSERNRTRAGSPSSKEHRPPILPSPHIWRCCAHTRLYRRARAIPIAESY